MARPKTIRDEDILAVAHDLFLERGMSVPTAEIAQRAGVSEGSIFRRFRTKDALFFAAMSTKMPDSAVARLEEMPGNGEVRENLRRLVLDRVKLFRVLVPRVIALSGSGKLPSGASSDGARCPAGPHSRHRQEVEAVSRYLAREVALRRLRCHDTEMLTRVLMAATWNYVLFEAQGAPVYRSVDADTFAARLVDTLWAGIAPPDPPLSPAPPPAPPTRG